jgi:hypothetical protein
MQLAGVVESSAVEWKAIKVIGMNMNEKRFKFALKASTERNM